MYTTTPSAHHNIGGRARMRMPMLLVSVHARAAAHPVWD